MHFLWKIMMINVFAQTALNQTVEKPLWLNVGEAIVFIWATIHVTEVWKDSVCTELYNSDESL